jgi:hypothetical protein
MHCRLDDDDVLNTINVSSHSYAASTPSQEYEQTECEDVLDNDDESFVLRVRAANYIMAEDKLICATWKKVGMDAVVGMEQPKEAYWAHMWEYFSSRNKSGNERNKGYVRHRWQTINTDSTKWSACLAQVRKLNKSGINSDDFVSLSSMNYFYLAQYLIIAYLVITYSLLLFSFVEQHCPKFVQRNDQEGPKWPTH